MGGALIAHTEHAQKDNLNDYMGVASCFESAYGVWLPV